VVDERGVADDAFVGNAFDRWDNEDDGDSTGWCDDDDEVQSCESVETCSASDATADDVPLVVPPPRQRVHAVDGSPLGKITLDVKKCGKQFDDALARTEQQVYHILVDNPQEEDFLAIQKR
jgi:hypothetical protein